MDHHLGISLSDRDYELLASKYSSDPKRVNYKKFVDNMVEGNIYNNIIIYCTCISD